MRKFRFTLDNGTKLTINPPSNRLFEKYSNAKNDRQVFEAMAEICNNNDEKVPVTLDYVLDECSIFDSHRFTAEFPKWINDTRDSDPN